MPEYIEREKAIEKMCEGCNIDFSDQPCEPCDCRLRRGLRELPTADVAEVRHGEWKPCFEDWRKQIEGDECSVCGFQHYGTTIRDYHYCPNCGAKMDGFR